MLNTPQAQERWAATTSAFHLLDWAVSSHRIGAWCVGRVGAEADRARGLSVLLLWAGSSAGYGLDWGSYQGGRVVVRIGPCTVMNITVNTYCLICGDLHIMLFTYVISPNPSATL